MQYHCIGLTPYFAQKEANYNLVNDHRLDLIYFFIKI